MVYLLMGCFALQGLLVIITFFMLKIFATQQLLLEEIMNILTKWEKRRPR